jgi:hypothetical protein
MLNVLISIKFLHLSEFFETYLIVKHDAETTGGPLKPLTVISEKGIVELGQ